MQTQQSSDNLQSPQRIRSVFVSPISTSGAPRYKWPHPIENFCGKLNEFKRIAMRAGKIDASLNAIVHLADALINSG